ncbi:hypothetical protein FRC01_005483 [Tulasnella sp. 417]|nr:hypothetical protein FRC01_005483 [Tulasnella sp. 417]
MALLPTKSLPHQAFATAIQPRSGRYRYFSTPILLPHSSQTRSIRRYSYATVQKARLQEPITPWPVAGPSVWRQRPTPFPAAADDELDHFATLMERNSPKPESSFFKAPPVPTLDMAVKESASTAPLFAKPTILRPKRRILRASTANNVAEMPLLQEEDDGEVGLLLREYLEGAQPPRYDWRNRAVSRLSPQQVEQWFKQRRRYRFKPAIDQVTEGEPYYAEIKHYQSKFLPLIQLEQLANDAVLKERLREWSEERLIEEGYRITGLSGFWQTATFFGRPVAVFSLGPGEKFGWNRFERGHQVQLSGSVEAKKKLEPYLGSIVEVSDTKIKVTFDEKFDLGSYEQLDLWSSDVASQRMTEAVRSLDVNLENNLPIGSATREPILQGTFLRDVLLQEFRNPSLESPSGGEQDLAITQPGAFSEDHLIQSWAHRYIRPSPIPIPGDPVLKDLNESQLKAIALMIGNKISLIQGPPGTGKTRTIAETVKILKAHFQVPQPILICTYTNVAVDNLIEALVAAGVNPLRVASPGKVKESVAQYSLEAKMEAHPLNPELDELTKDLTRLRDRRDETHKKCLEQIRDKSPRVKSTIARYEKLQAQIKRKDSMAFKVRMTMLHEITHSADVICTTCISSASLTLHVIDFPVVFMDEASMCMEPASLIPLMKGCQHLALIGDHQQLPPIITSPEALEGGLGTSLFERLINGKSQSIVQGADKPPPDSASRSKAVPTVMLDQQYRMHPDIAAFPAKEFYDGMLRDGVVDSKGQVHKRLSPPASKHLRAVASEKPRTENGDVPSMVFIHHSGAENKRDKSRVNETEANIVCDLIEDLLAQNPTLRGESIGVIAPYAAQITLLGRLLQVDSTPHQRFVESLGEFRAAETGSIEVKTVDGFEGREKDVIIFSTVRSNTTGYIGFLADRRRLNVGLTRAKRALFVVGNAKTLRTGRVGHVEGAGLVAAWAGAGAKNVKFDIAVDIAADAAAVPKDGPLKNGGESSTQTNPPAVVRKTTRAPSRGIWSRYLDWLDTCGLIYDWANNKKLP